ncbi:MAG: hypothetical protein UW43_C0002G0059 [Candidatus Yanofskybacteria bacterium GW2011_GWA1_44_21]|uniref:Uncharacterized protein n=2 Tax=Parcubacteria group TaxID=1794811 RepID=A0A1F8H041_9BACT|nr:MAG: hypothetical protein UU38_C0004G0031 [Candidatus Wolfebacteria bacterium GW2011_GWB1_41_12]KKT28921.1 MAG: hypothetical protein UW14_C0001G0032 [Candidatus Yanofskybacteria bacterium GW2011_GWA2_44_10]KKT50775.1 MAG: hypothetical protein UW43_C0002G0059 [Candidatus Yanofskybacteria bacterium GW2011_GWA1_44_21]OGN02880.1 MAG: hypothetical protein A2657_02690 [Candidatus Yanofskybacteria bacterium RIFCSPHIGHO2_01_FULL_44_110b]OGN14151.1 MAG: hypothetical protein A3C01_00960 [Candidatus Ya
MPKAFLSAIEALRRRAVEWVSSATADEILELPAAMLGLSSDVGSDTNGGKRRRRLLKKAARELTPSECDEIRTKLGSLDHKTPQYRKMRDNLARHYGATRRQIACAVSTHRAWQKKESAK